MDIKQLKYFYTIAEEGQITSAAKKLNIAQPPLSYQLKMLEEELGVKLIERGSRRIRLTDAGHLLRHRAEQILELADTATKELKDFSAGIQGTLSIGTVSSSGAAILTDKFKAFQNKYPLVKFELHEGNTFKILEILSRGLIEIGIVRTPFNFSGIESKALPLEPMVAAMTKDMQLDDTSDFITIKELASKPLIIYRRFEKLILQCFEKQELFPNIFCINDDARTTLLWAKTGLGIAIVPESAIKLIGDYADFKIKPINESTLMTQILVIWMKDRYLSNSAKHFLEIF
ncbi:LysR family transcriptional regulator [Clostridium sp. 19966]|uniref:LysR family transcriptional regulator n=1 Tax=Clostridium sp. 19966 TaxID=2768166 RepID=UPI0028E09E0B|nr:LysR family transcriptional regulator [Clostridium sp. 19966]MDT8715175.1 LysR family transcriptional regulator [Clostridium sp. 19966]